MRNSKKITNPQIVSFDLDSDTKKARMRSPKSCKIMINSCTLNGILCDTDGQRINGLQKSLETLKKDRMRIQNNLIKKKIIKKVKKKIDDGLSQINLVKTSPRSKTSNKIHDQVPPRSLKKQKSPVKPDTSKNKNQKIFSFNEHHPKTFEKRTKLKKVPQKTSASNLTNEKPDIIKKLIKLKSRIKRFKDKKISPQKAPLSELNQAASKIQALIRGYLVRKTFSKNFKSKQSKTQTITKKLEKAFEDPTLKSTESSKDAFKLDLKMNLLQIKQLVKLKEIEMKKIDNFIKKYNYDEKVKLKFEEIINRRYFILGQSLTKKIGEIKLLQNFSSLLKFDSKDQQTKLPKNLNALENDLKLQKIQNDIINDSLSSIKSIQKSRKESSEISFNELIFEKNQPLPDFINSEEISICECADTQQPFVYNPVFCQFELDELEYEEVEPITDDILMRLSNETDENEYDMISINKKYNISSFVSSSIDGNSIRSSSSFILEEIDILDTPSNSILIETIVFNLEFYLLEYFLDDILGNLKLYEIEYSKNRKTVVRGLNFDLNLHVRTDMEYIMEFYDKVADKYKNKIFERMRGFGQLDILLRIDEFLLGNKVFFDIMWNFSVEDIGLHSIFACIHNKMLMEALTQALNTEFYNSISISWLPLQSKTEKDPKSIILAAKARIKSWCSVEAGKIPEHNMLTYLGNLDEDKLQTTRENKLNSMVKHSLLEEDDDWLDTKYFMISIGLYFEDNILYELVDEVTNILGTV
jgi:IQ calmodulin-binding motif